MKRMMMIAAVGVLSITGCATSQSPDAIRQNTANATATAARDAKAVAQGVYEGLRQKGPVNVNTASKTQLETLPGIDSAAADRIIAGRPYATSIDLRKKGVLSRAEYDRVANHVKTK